MIRTYMSYDTETTGLDWSLGDKVFTYSTCTFKGETEVKRIDGGAVRKVVNTEHLRKLWTDDSIIKVMHHAKFDLHMTEGVLGRELDIPFTNDFHDTLILSKLLVRSLSFGLKDLCWEMFGYPKDDEQDVLKFAPHKRYDLVPEHIMTKYQIRDAERTMLLFRALYPELLKHPALKAIYDMEIMLIRHTLRSEQLGLKYDKEEAATIKVSLTKQLKELTHKMQNTYGRYISGSSGDDVAWLLYDKLGLDEIKKTKKKKRSTDLEVLNFYRLRGVEAASDVMHMRALSYGLSAMKSYEKYCASDGRVHPGINTYGAITGRESCTKPNLQNVSKDSSGRNPYAFPARRLFIVDEGYVNLYIDFAGIELRLIANCSKDIDLIALIRSGRDPHMYAARVFYGNLYKYIEARPDAKEAMIAIRYAAKQGTYALAYGASGKKLGIVLGLLPAEGLQALKRYRDEFRGVARFSKECIDTVSKNGTITTEFGRVIRCDRHERYKAPNYMVQGTAADILKMAYVRVADYMREAMFGEAGIVLPIHDELMIRYPISRLNELDEHLDTIKTLMTYYENLVVPMKVEVKISEDRWINAHDYIGQLKEGE